MSPQTLHYILYSFVGLYLSLQKYEFLPSLVINLSLRFNVWQPDCINKTLLNERTLTYRENSSSLSRICLQATFINKLDRNWPGSSITKFWAPRINFEKNVTSQISIFYHLISQAFKRELKTKEPVIMSTLETVRLFLTEPPLEGLEKLYQEHRGNWMWSCNNILIEGSAVTEQTIHSCC